MLEQANPKRGNFRGTRDCSICTFKKIQRLRMSSRGLSLPSSSYRAGYKKVQSLIHFDEIDGWAPQLSSALQLYLPSNLTQILASAAPTYVEDARELLFRHTNREAIVDATLSWIGQNRVAGYHGSRLTDEEASSVLESGLTPLIAASRRDRLTRALSPHDEWQRIAPNLDATILSYGQHSRGGDREGQVHLTLSMAGLKEGFPHYLKYGSEFDQRVAFHLLGQDGMGLLALDGEPRVIRFSVPGRIALDAAHPFVSMDDLQSRGSVPNMVKEFLEAWSFKLSDPSFQSDALTVDCGMVFREVVPANWILGIETLLG